MPLLDHLTGGANSSWRLAGRDSDLKIGGH
jgi:hypothetical protein